MEVWSLEKAGMGDDDWLMCDDGLMYNSRQINTVYGRLVQNERRVDGLMYTCKEYGKSRDCWIRESGMWH